MSLYVNPVLSDRDFGFARLGGPGLANCMFLAARAAILSKRLGATMLRPTWERIGIGQWFRREKDKRFYVGLFRKDPHLSGLKKFLLVKNKHHYDEGIAVGVKDGVVMVSGLRGYFSDLWADSDYVRQYFAENILPSAISNVPDSMGNAIAVHVRLGDYPAHWRTDIGWYEESINIVLEEWKKRNSVISPTVKLFSDGTDKELSRLLSIEGVERADFGNALADIIAISRCSMLIGSDSTFSGWGAFLGNVPCMFAHLHYGYPLKDYEKVIISKDAAERRGWVDKEFLSFSVTSKVGL